MAWIEALLAVTALGICAAALTHLLALEREIGDAANRWRRSADLLVEVQNLQRRQLLLAEAQQFAETVVDTGASAVRTVHFGIASIPFGILEAMPVTRDAGRMVRYAHDTIADAVYGTIGGVNRIAGRALRAALGTGRTAPHAPDQPKDRS